MPDQESPHGAAPSTPLERIDALGARLFDLKNTKERLEAEVEKVSKEIFALSTKDLAVLMTEAEVEKRKLPAGTVYISDEIYANVRKADRPRLYAWMRANGKGHYVEEFVFPKRMSDFAKEVAEEGTETPDYINVAIVPTVHTRRKSAASAAGGDAD